MINHITKSTWTQKDGKMGYCYRVYYEPTRGRAKGRQVTYSFFNNLPLTVINFILNANACETTYTDRGKVERFTM